MAELPLPQLLQVYLGTKEQEALSPAEQAPSPTNFVERSRQTPLNHNLQQAEAVAMQELNALEHHLAEKDVLLQDESCLKLKATSNHLQPLQAALCLAHVDCHQSSLETVKRTARDNRSNKSQQALQSPAAGLFTSHSLTT